MATFTVRPEGIIQQPALTMPGNATGSEAACTALTASQIRSLCSVYSTSEVDAIAAAKVSAASLALGTSGSDLNWLGTTLNVPDAGAAARGVVTIGSQTFAGAKSFTGSVSIVRSTATGVALTLQSTDNSTANVLAKWTRADGTLKGGISGGGDLFIGSWISYNVLTMDASGPILAAAYGGFRVSNTYGETHTHIGGSNGLGITGNYGSAFTQYVAVSGGSGSLGYGKNLLMFAVPTATGDAYIYNFYTYGGAAARVILGTQPHYLNQLVLQTTGNVSFGTTTDTGEKLHVAGSLGCTGALNFPPITKAALLALTPTAATAGRWRVTDATPASRGAYPDGTNWRYTSDDTIVV